MTGPRVVVLLGSREGPVSLCDEVFGRRLRAQLRNLGVAYQATGAPFDQPADPLAAEVARVRAASGRCHAVLTSVETGDVVGLDTFLAASADLGFGPAEVRLVCERQDRLAEYALLAPLRTGVGTPLGEFAHDHANIASALQARDDVATVIASPYEQVAAGVPTWTDAVLQLIGVRGRVDLRGIVHVRTPPRALRYCSPTGLALGRALRDDFTTPDERERFYAFLVSAFPAGPDRLLADDVRRDIVARHRDANRAFLAEFGEGVDPGSYDDDAATARLATMRPAVRVPPPKVTDRARRAVDITRQSLRERLHRGS